MFILNVTFHIEDCIHTEALEYIRKEYIPRACQSGILSNPLFRFIHANHEDSGKSYSIQFHSKDQQSIMEWWKLTGSELHNEISSQFNDKLLGFTTLLEDIEI